jgi:ParB/RepB/Spo0J family partition protein
MTETNPTSSSASRNLAAPEVEQPARDVVYELNPADVLTPEGNRQFDPADCRDLLESMRNMGQLVPGIVFRHPTIKGKWLCVEGNRRRYCTSVLGTLFKTVIADGSPTKVGLIKTRLTANCIREAMSPFDIARDVTDYMEAEGISNQSEVAERLNLSKATLNRALGTQRIPGDLHELARQVTHSAYLISTLPTREEMKEVLTIAVGPPLMTRDQISKLVAERKGKKTKPAKCVKLKTRRAVQVSFPKMDAETLIGELSTIIENVRRCVKHGLPLEVSLPSLLKGG